MKSLGKVFTGLFSLGLLIVAAGCATTTVMESNPQVARSANEAHANVYFMRKMPQRTRGVADADLKVEIDEMPLLQLSRGEYALVRIRPGDMDIIIRNKTFLTTKPAPVEVWRADRFHFESNKTYYVLAKFFQEEFRGIYFKPVLISEEEAKELGKFMNPAGELAEANPLYVPPKQESKPFNPLENILD